LAKEKRKCPHNRKGFFLSQDECSLEEVGFVLVISNETQAGNLDQVFGMAQVIPPTE
jgi:hypothetical protein